MTGNTTPRPACTAAPYSAPHPAQLRTISLPLPPLCPSGKQLPLLTPLQCMARLCAQRTAAVLGLYCPRPCGCSHLRLRLGHIVCSAPARLRPITVPPLLASSQYYSGHQPFAACLRAVPLVLSYAPGLAAPSNAHALHTARSTLHRSCTPYP
jgi:hypothetical protein